MSSYIAPPSPSSWAVDSYYGPQPDFIQAVEETSFDYPPPPSPPSDGASTPRTPPQPSLPIPSSPKRSSRKALARSDTPPPPTKSAVASGSSGSQPWSQPTISTFSASSSSFNHIHIVQPYLQGSAGSSTGATDLFSNSGIHFVGMGGPSSDGRPPRPANAWILYRSAKMKVLKEPQTSGQPRRTQADISKLIAEMWKNETPEVRQYYEAMSDMKKAEHLAQYPTYRFQPMKKADKEKARLEKKAQKERERAEAALTRPRGSRSRRRQAAAASADELQPAGQIAGFPPGTQVLAWGTTPTTHSAAFQPYAKPSKRSSSTTRKPPTPSEQSQPLSPQSSVEKPDAKCALTPLNTAFVPPSTISPSDLSGVAQSATAEQFQYVQDWAQTPYSAHPDYSYPSVPSLMTNFGESTSVLPTGWHNSPANFNTYATPTSACSTSAPSLPQAPQPSEFLNLFTNPGTTFTAPLPPDFDCSSGSFDFPELGQITDLDQLFGPGGLDPAAFESFAEPSLSESSTTSQQHHQQSVMAAPAPTLAASHCFYEPAPLSAGLEVPVQYQEFAPQTETSVEVVTSSEATPAYGLDTSYFTVAPPSYTPSAPVVYAHAAAAQPPRKQSVASPPEVYSYGGHYDLSAYQQTPWSVHS